MKIDLQRQILDALLLVLRPIARALLRAGVGYREFSEIAKSAFVETATIDYGLRGRPTNVSRVAVMTGLTRKEVRRIRNKSEAQEQTVILKTAPVSQILHRWHTDEEFLTSSGTPRSLQFDGDDVTFSSLVKKYGGDIPPGAMRTELIRINAIKICDGDRIEPIKRIAYNVEIHERLIGGLANIIYPAALNLVHNLELKDDAEWWTNLVATSKFVRTKDIGRIMKISSDRMMEFATSLDDLFGAYEVLFDNEQNPEDHKAVGIGVFYFEEEKSQTDIFT